MTYTPSFDTSFETRLAKIDLTAVMAHVAEDTGLGAADLERAEDLYRKFLTLVAANTTGKAVVPPRIADYVWHAHITFTRQYAADCELLFGRFLHHDIQDGDTTESYADTVFNYQRYFGVDVRNCGLSKEEFSLASPCGGG
jgi:hypothetical protein